VTLKIVSGGQTGVDRAALDAALEAGCECGGWCPPGRWAEDGAVPARYPLKELPVGSCPERTRRNIEDSDGTLVIWFAGAGPGTLLTLEHAAASGKPLLTIDGGTTRVTEAIDKVMKFVECCAIRTLNVGGPRVSEARAAHGYTRQVVAGLLQRALNTDQGSPEA
jgi:hypothetical protein